MINNYEKLNNGIIKQKSFFNHKQQYDVEYIKDRYDKYNQLSMYMSYLRVGYLISVIKQIPNRILDVGFGNGDFLKVAKNIIPDCHGFEVNSYNIPDGCINVDNIYKHTYDVICFFDVLEHFEDIYEIRNLKTEYIYISVPECHNFSDEWFLTWKHRRPDEHLWHFNLAALNNFMKEIGYENIQYSNIEDSIRKPVDNNSNILTAIYKKI